MTVFTAVSFAKVPVLLVGPLLQEILNRGWTWSRNDADGIYHFYKEVPKTGTATKDAEAEIASVMGEYYIDANELKERAEQWKRFMLGEGPPPEFASAENASA